MAIGTLLATLAGTAMSAYKFWQDDRQNRYPPNYLMMRDMMKISGKYGIPMNMMQPMIGMQNMQYMMGMNPFPQFQFQMPQQPQFQYQIPPQPMMQPQFQFQIPQMPQQVPQFQYQVPQQVPQFHFQMSQQPVTSNIVNALAQQQQMLNTACLAIQQLHQQLKLRPYQYTNTYTRSTYIPTTPVQPQPIPMSTSNQPAWESAADGSAQYPLVTVPPPIQPLPRPPVPPPVQPIPQYRPQPQPLLGANQMMLNSDNDLFWNDQSARANVDPNDLQAFVSHVVPDNYIGNKW